MLLENMPPEVAWKTTGKLLVVSFILFIVSLVLPAGFDFTSGFYMPWMPYFLSYPTNSYFAFKPPSQVQAVGGVFYAMSLIPKALVILFICIAVVEIVKQGNAKMDPITIILSRKVVLAAIFSLAFSLYIMVPIIPGIIASLGNEFLYSGTVSPEFIITEALNFLLNIVYMVIFVISAYILVLIQQIHASVNISV
ncbi:MAG TPA: hypothetical protein VKM55_06440 [Candidatus Lokiarchaeia archaeon]|nr:hypothetical protein [Candidatus Lokiarchaeia archaeon]